MQYNPPTGALGANDPYIGKIPTAGQQGSKIPPTVPELTQREIVNVITASGQSPTNIDPQQLLKAVRTGQLGFYTDTGTADAMVITPNPPFTVIPVGAEFTIQKAAAPNATAAPTLAVNNLVPVAIVKENGLSPLLAGDLPSGSMITVRWDGAAFRIRGQRKSDVAGSFPPASLWHTGTTTSASTASALIATVSPAVPTRISPLIYEIIPATACAGATTLDVGFGPTALRRQDGTTLLAGDYAAGQPLFIVDDGTVFRCVGLSSVSITTTFVAQTAIGKGETSWKTAGSYQFTVPAGVYWIYATVVGGGGGAPGAAAGGGSAASSGGGGGGTARGWFPVTPGQIINVVVGAGGGGTAYNTIANSGGTSSAGSFMQATGGVGRPLSAAE